MNSLLLCPFSSISQPGPLGLDSVQMLNLHSHVKKKKDKNVQKVKFSIAWSHIYHSVLIPRNKWTNSIGWSQSKRPFLIKESKIPCLILCDSSLAKFLNKKPNQYLLFSLFVLHIWLCSWYACACVYIHVTIPVQARGCHF